MPSPIRPEKSIVDVDEERRIVTTTFSDGSALVAAPTYDEESVIRARALGYAGTGEEAVWAMTRHHDLLHTLIAEARGQGCSPTLHAVARGVDVDSRTADDEERLVMFIARALNVGIDCS